MIRLRLLAGVAAGLLISTAASAGSLGGTTVPALDVTLTWGETGGENRWHANPTGVANPNATTFDFDGSVSRTNWNLSWDVTLDPDPFVNGVFGVTNNTSSLQTFVLTVLLPISPAIPGGTLVGGSIGGSVTDANASGFAELKTLSGVALFTGMNDLNTALTIYDDPAVFTANLFPGQTVTIPALNVGLPPSIASIPALSTIAIQLTFVLTPGDTASFTTFYQVEPIPEPATVVLMGLGIGGLAVAGRRRS